MKTQCECLLEYFADGRPITPLGAWSELGIYRLASRVWDLKKAGWNIVKVMVSVKNRWGEKCSVSSYTLEGRKV